MSVFKQIKASYQKGIIRLDLLTPTYRERLEKSLSDYRPGKLKRVFLEEKLAFVEKLTDEADRFAQHTVEDDIRHTRFL